MPLILSIIHKFGVLAIRFNGGTYYFRKRCYEFNVKAGMGISNVSPVLYLEWSAPFLTEVISCNLPSRRVLKLMVSNYTRVQYALCELELLKIMFVGRSTTWATRVPSSCWEFWSCWVQNLFQEISLRNAQCWTTMELQSLEEGLVEAAGQYIQPVPHRKIVSGIQINAA